MRIDNRPERKNQNEGVFVNIGTNKPKLEKQTELNFGL